MRVYLQATALPDRCFLHEVLLWVAFGRLPIVMFNNDGKELRDSTDLGGYVAEVAHPSLDDEECRRASIPSDPSYTALIEDRSMLEPGFYRDLLIKFQHDEEQQEELARQEELAIKFAEECAGWKGHYLKAIEYPASQIFVALRSGRFEAKGRLLPKPSKTEALTILDEQGRDIYDLAPSTIPADFWTLSGIDFESSAAWNGEAHYCHITLMTEELLSIFPGERTTTSVEQVGDTFVLSEAGKPAISEKRRGRPAYPWEPFYVELAAQVQEGRLPAKKEAAIHYFQAWFAKELGVRPSRAAIGEKLTPYYERFIRRGQKS